MIKSMTGYGGGKASCAEYELSVELRSVNNRFVDINVRTPRGFLFLEEPVKSAVQARISRGKVDVFITYTALLQSDVTVVVNEALAAEYKAAIDRIASSLGLAGELTAYQLGKLSDVLTLDKKEMDKEAILSALLHAVELSLSEHEAMRLSEGKKLLEDINARLRLMESYVARVEERSPETVREYREKLLAKMRDILDGAQIDESRILTEAALFADRVAVDEETVRLKSHIAQMRQVLSSDVPVGRKLDFIVQEMNREVNTIGSKSNDGSLTHIVLELKSEIEKIREQIQNIE